MHGRSCRKARRNAAPGIALGACPILSACGGVTGVVLPAGTDGDLE